MAFNMKNERSTSNFLVLAIPEHAIIMQSQIDACIGI